MSRELKFRAWDKKLKKWVTGSGEGFNLFGECTLIGGVLANSYYTDNVFERLYADVEVEQYTGLNDNKRTKEFLEGQPIYESDIVKSIWQVDHETIIVGKVHYYSMFALWALMNANGDMMSPCWNDTEVIGDIHEHPDLLKGD